MAALLRSPLLWLPGAASIVFLVLIILAAGLLRRTDTALGRALAGLGPALPWLVLFLASAIVMIAYMVVFSPVRTLPAGSP